MKEEPTGPAGTNRKKKGRKLKRRRRTNH